VVEIEVEVEEREIVILDDDINLNLIKHIMKIKMHEKGRAINDLVCGFLLSRVISVHIIMMIVTKGRRGIEDRRKRFMIQAYFCCVMFLWCSSVTACGMKLFIPRVHALPLIELTS
jgi:hypothetical protein